MIPGEWVVMAVGLGLAFGALYALLNPPKHHASGNGAAWHEIDEYEERKKEFLEKG